MPATSLGIKWVEEHLSETKKDVFKLNTHHSSLILDKTEA